VDRKERGLLGHPPTILKSPGQGPAAVTALASAYSSRSAGLRAVPYRTAESSLYLKVVTATTVPVPVRGSNPVSHGPPLSPAVMSQRSAAVPLSRAGAVGPAQ
jgi:hypothetical protein